MFFRKNKYFLISIAIILMAITMSFYDYYKQNFSYIEGYNIIKENCYDGKNKKHEYCKRFSGPEHLEQYIKRNEPGKVYRELDAITLTCSIVELTLFSTLQLFSPLLVVIATVGLFHSEFSSGMFKNFLTRINYKNYLKRIWIKALKTACITPLALILIFIISCLVTRFNFNIPLEVKSTIVFSEWKYNNFLIYGIGICGIQFLISIFYSNMAIFCCQKNKNKLVAIIMGYIMFILSYVSIYFVYGLIINRLFGLKNMGDYFNIAGYWFFESGAQVLYVILIAFVLQFVSSLLLYISFRKKERVIMENEKQIA